MDKEHYMSLALELARQAASCGEVPVGCVIVNDDGEVIGRGRNRREEKKSALSHAECEAIEQACTTVGDWRLSACTLYVTLEPCPMCAGAIINARIPTLVYGARDESMGSCSSVINLFEESYGHRPAIYAGVLEAACAELLTEFFKNLRNEKI